MDKKEKDKEFIGVIKLVSGEEIAKSQNTSLQFVSIIISTSNLLAIFNKK